MNKIFAVLWAVTLVVVVVIAIGAADMYRVQYINDAQGGYIKHDRSTHKLYQFVPSRGGWHEVKCSNNLFRCS